MQIIGPDTRSDDRMISSRARIAPFALASLAGPALLLCLPSREQGGAAMPIVGGEAQVVATSSSLHQH